MNILVLTDARGVIIGTARQATHSEVRIGIAPEKGQKVHSLEVPDDLAGLKATDLHARLGEYIKPAKREPSRSR